MFGCILEPQKLFGNLLLVKYYRVFVITALLLASLVVIFPLPPISQPTKLISYNFETALDVFDNQREEIVVNSPTCSDKVLHHNQKTSKVIVLFHGFTNCPAQFSELSKQFWQKGYNVIIPRLPYHGNINRISTETKNLKTIDLIDKVQIVIYVAKALGDEVEVVGISAGATVAIWTSLNFKITKLLVIAPLISPAKISLWAIPATEKLLSILPNQFWWWDSKVKSEIPGPNYAYPNFSTKALLAFIQLNKHSLSIVNNQILAHKSTTAYMILIANDEAINNSVAIEFMHQLLPAFKEHLNIITLGSGLNLQHDIIDPNQPYTNTSLVYPIILNIF